MKMRQRVQRVLAMLMAVTVMSCTGLTAFAAEGAEANQSVDETEVSVDAVESIRQATTDIVVNSHFTWNQNDSSALIFPSFYCDDANNINIYFECIARSTNVGSFKVKLQRRGKFGVWSTVSNVYTAAQQNTQSYNNRTGQYVQGAWSRFSWNVTKGGDYRIVVEEASNKQSTELTGVYIWKRQ